MIGKRLSSEEAAVQAGASAPVGSGWFRKPGDLSPSQYSTSAPSLSGRYLTFGEREEIAPCYAQGLGVCVIARRIGRAASTISRELRRNAAPRRGGFEYREQQRNGMQIALKTPQIHKAGSEPGIAPICRKKAL